jgi:hypothetical protein
MMSAMGIRFRFKPRGQQSAKSTPITEHGVLVVSDAQILRAGKLSEFGRALAAIASLVKSSL